MLTAAAVFAALAGLLHVYIWVMESLVFTTRGRRVFGVSAEEAANAHVQSLFYNQGFYNLFLAIGTLVGVVITLGDWCQAGPALMAFGTGSMLGAAIVLVTHDSKMLRGAVVQGTFPLLALVLLGLAALTR
jgi:putative membrane protein